MKIFSIILGFLVTSCVCQNAVSAADGQWMQSLDGQWNFTTMFDPTDEDWSPITVPGNWDATDEYSDHSGIGWYRREFVPDASLQGKRVRIRFEAVYHESEVFLNRQRLGKHVGGYAPFEFDVTDKLKYGQSNTITIRADNSYQRGAWWPWGGISRSVNLVANNDVRLQWQHIRSEPNLDDGSARLFIRYRIVNDGTDDAEVAIVSRLDDPSIEVTSLSVTVSAGETLETDAEADLASDQVRLWHFDRPNLYQLNTTLSVDGELQHAKTDRFGIRKIELTPTAIMLNGEPMRLVGFNRVSDHPKLGNTEPDDLVNQDVDLMKNCGAVFSRIMHYPQAPNLLNRLDEKGMMVFCEIPVWQDDPQIITDNPITMQWLAEMIHRDYNHPCIIGWSVGNEMLDFHPYATSMMKYVREELDPHRHVTFVSYRAPREGKDEPIDQTDIAMINTYGKWAKQMESVAERWPTKPIFISEFGLGQLKPDGRLNEGFVEEWNQLKSGNPRVVGASIWTFNDYRSNYKGTQPTGFRTWGVVDENRNPKSAYYTLRKLYSPLRELKIADRKAIVQTRGSDEVPCYTLRGYKLRWTVESDDGQAIESGELPIPDLKPGAEAWSIALPDSAVANDRQQLVLSLVTPLGYVVDDTRLGDLMPDGDPERQ